MRWIIWLIWSLLLFAVLGFATSTESSISSFRMTAASFVFGVMYFMLAPKTLPRWRREKLFDVLIAGLALYFTGAVRALF